MAELPGLGPRPVGDPCAMRGAAGRLAALAARIERAPEPRLGVWQSPAASEARCRIGATSGSLQRAGGQLRTAAAVLREEADAVEAAQRRWEARRERLEQEALLRRVTDPAWHGHIPPGKV